MENGPQADGHVGQAWKAGSSAKEGSCGLALSSYTTVSSRHSLNVPWVSIQYKLREDKISFKLGDCDLPHPAQPEDGHDAAGSHLGDVAVHRISFKELD